MPALNSLLSSGGYHHFYASLFHWVTPYIEQGAYRYRSLDLLDLRLQGLDLAVQQRLKGSQLGAGSARMSIIKRKENEDGMGVRSVLWLWHCVKELNNGLMSCEID